jgi:hypothetical protein
VLVGAESHELVGVESLEMEILLRGLRVIWLRPVGVGSFPLWILLWLSLLDKEIFSGVVGAGIVLMLRSVVMGTVRDFRKELILSLGLWLNGVVLLPSSVMGWDRNYFNLGLFLKLNWARMGVEGWRRIRRTVWIRVRLKLRLTSDRIRS